MAFSAAGNSFFNASLAALRARGTSLPTQISWTPTWRGGYTHSDSGDGAGAADTIVLQAATAKTMPVNTQAFMMKRSNLKIWG